MSPFKNKIMNRILRNRIKTPWLTVSILFIAYVIIWYYAFKDGKVNHFYNGLGQIDMAIIWFLIGIDSLRKQEKKYFILWFVISLVGLFLGIQNLLFLNTHR